MRDKFRTWLRLLIVVIPLLGFLIFVNCFFDPANIFHNVSRPIADSLLSGKATFITSGNMNERLVKQYFIEDMPEQTECITVGPSTIFGIRSEHVGTKSYYNLGVSGADFYDVVAQFALLDINEKKVDRVIFCMDNYFFNESLYGSFTRNAPWKPYAEYMMGTLDGKSMQIPKRDTKAERIEQFRQLFSITYFQSCIDYIKTNGSLKIARWGEAKEQYEGAYYLPDGSMIYAKDYRENTTVSDVTNAANGYDMDYQFTPYAYCNARSMEYFEKLIVYLQEQGTEVDLFLCPLCPTLWDRYDEERYPILPQIEAFAHEMADKYGLDVIGSYNPYELGISDEDFHDARHIKHDRLEAFFDFK
ncbi:MAG: hypothetical protein E7287_10860 [Lachnospiraceae bacterium]|nr:hypothetical protein [Lachnospiraceae bacterium]